MINLTKRLSIQRVVDLWGRHVFLRVIEVLTRLLQREGVDSFEGLTFILDLLVACKVSVDTAAALGTDATRLSGVVWVSTTGSSNER